MNIAGLSEAEAKAAATAFEKLGVCLQLAEAAASLGWKVPSAIQEQAVPHLLAGSPHFPTPPLHLLTHASTIPPFIKFPSPLNSIKIAFSSAQSCALVFTPLPWNELLRGHAGRDVIGLAQTGSGKTGAFALPILQDLLQKQTKNFALVLSPTRELAIQVRPRA